MTRVIKVKMKPPPEDLVEVFDEVEQGSADWHALHIGVPTASRFSQVLAEGKEGPDSGVRMKLLRRLAAEVIFEQPLDSFSNADMARGKDHEPWLLEQYDVEMHRRAFGRDEEHPGIRRVGFVRRTISYPLMAEPLVVGCSPDALVGEDGVVECKSMRPDLLVGLLDSGRFPSEHRAQCQGSLWVTGRQWCDLRIGYQGFPLRYSARVLREEPYIATLRNEVERFAWDLKKLIERVRAKGTK